MYREVQRQAPSTKNRSAREAAARKAKTTHNLQELVEICQDSPPVRLRFELFEEMTRQGLPTDDLDPVQLLARYPELVACCATDGYFRCQTGLFLIDVKGESASIAHAAAGAASELNKIFNK